jgi:hypothetical protein
MTPLPPVLLRMLPACSPPLFLPSSCLIPLVLLYLPTRESISTSRNFKSSASSALDSLSTSLKVANYLTLQLIFLFASTGSNGISKLWTSLCKWWIESIYHRSLAFAHLDKCGFNSCSTTTSAPLRRFTIYKNGFLTSNRQLAKAFVLFYPTLTTSTISYENSMSPKPSKTIPSSLRFSPAYHLISFISILHGIVHQNKKKHSSTCLNV